MQSTKLISTYIQAQKWDELMFFITSEDTSQIFEKWIKNNENEYQIESLIKSLPDKCLPELIIKYDNIVIPYLIKNYRESYASIALNLANNELKGNNKLFALFDPKMIKITLENIVPSKFLEKYHTYLYLKLIEKDEYNYKNIPIKALKSKQKYINASDILKEICENGINIVSHEWNAAWINALLFLPGAWETSGQEEVFVSSHRHRQTVSFSRQTVLYP